MIQRNPFLDMLSDDILESIAQDIANMAPGKREALEETLVAFDPLAPGVLERVPAHARHTFGYMLAQLGRATTLVPPDLAVLMLRVASSQMALALNLQARVDRINVTKVANN